jgi:dihydrofolate synthase/folylpolyglutamate synthase
VAGTNGKGSTSAITHSILQNAGYKVGLYTSPHLVSFQERMVINGEYISPDEVVSLLERLKPAIKQVARREGCQHPTFFEVITTMAFLYFYEKKVDFAIMEVGLGGRLDATNVCQPLVSVITHIDFDHMDRLGNTLTEIAGEKGAIIKENTPVVSAGQFPEAQDVIKKIARQKESPLYIFGEDIDATLISSQLKGNYFNYRGISNNIDNLFVPLAGDFQIENTSLAIATTELLGNSGYVITQDNIFKGVSHSKWPGRFEIVKEKPLVILDGAHNPNGVQQFIKNLKKLVPDKKIIAVLGIFQDKDYTTILKNIIPQVDKVILTMADNPRATPTAVLAEEVKHYINYQNIMESDDVETAINKSLQIARGDDVVCITGSLYTVGEAKAYFLEGKDRKR